MIVRMEIAPLHCGGLGCERAISDPVGVVMAIEGLIGADTPTPGPSPQGGGEVME